MLAATLILSAWPKQFVESAAGLNVESVKVRIACWLDPGTGWFALKTRECDGAHVAIIITKDRNVVEENGFDVPGFGREEKDFGSGEAIQRKSFAPKTRNKIAVGSKISTVVRILGTPTARFREGTRKQFEVLQYKAVLMTDKENGKSLENTYVFKEGRLIEIRLFRNLIPGC